MTDYITGSPAYIEFQKKGGSPCKGVFFVEEQDNYYIELKDEEVIQIISKRSITIYEPERDKWPKWVQDKY